MRLLSLPLFLVAALVSLRAATAPTTADVVIYGGTSSGVAAAIQTARMGKTAVLIEPTQFLGGLTTFSTFSAEVVTLLQQGRLLWAGGAIAAHLFGSLLLTLLGIATVTLFRTS